MWVKRGDNFCKAWIKNRIRKIRVNVESSNWRHILGELNPADIPTRKFRPKVLPQSWFQGPDLLKSPNEKWSILESVPPIPLRVGKE